MSLEDLYYLAGIIAAFGVVGSLIFVGLQVRQSTTAAKAAAAAAVHANFAEFYKSVQGDPVLMDLTLRGLRDYDSLTQTEKGQMASFFMAFNLYMQDAFLKWREGSLSPKLYRGWELVSMNMFGSPGGRAFWHDRGYLFSEDYQDYVNNDLMKRPVDETIKPFGAFALKPSE